ncbi:XRE family transcriptional regulator [Cronobacter turicensis]
MSDKKQSIKEFSERLKHIITALGTSGREFAARAGIGYSTLHNYLHAVSSPTLDNLVLLAKAGNVSVEWLATGQQSHKNSDSAVIAVPFIDRSSDVLKLDAQLLAKKELRSLYAIRISTDAMHPTFLPGAVLLIDINDTKLTDNKLVVMLQNGNYLFKRVQVLLDGICLLNDNNLYPSITVPNDEINNINVVGTVIMIINCVN